MVSRLSSRVVRLMFACAVVVVASTCPARAAGDAPVVHTTKGAVRGVAGDDGASFLGIPYAAPPVGSLRWRPPRPTSSWKGVRDAAKAGSSCPQPSSSLTRSRASNDEDCLYLNVYVPPGQRHHLPVMVWIHGGSFVVGSGSSYEASELAAKGHVVVVTINYRLGPLGFLALSALSGESGGKGSGNYALMDQQAALRWTRTNIAAFGGDPHDVTVFGQSAGGASVCAQLSSPAAAGLFERAIVESGPCGAALSSLHQAERSGAEFAAKLGCLVPAQAAACLRGKSVAAILKAAGAGSPTYLLNKTWQPTIGTALLPQQPADAIAAGRYNRVPVMLGSTTDEGTIFVAGVEQAGIPVNPLTYPAFLAVTFGAHSPEVLALYPASSYGGSAPLAASATLTDSDFACPSRRLAESLAGTTATYLYEFADRTAPNIYGVTPDFPLGAYHASEIPYLFREDSGGIVTLDAAQKRLSDQMIAYWTRFAAAGDPNGGTTPGWARFDSATARDLRFEPAGPVERSGLGEEHQCGFWAGLG
jgi:para-nitrobenzyl esterase